MRKPSVLPKLVEEKTGFERSSLRNHAGRGEGNSVREQLLGDSQNRGKLKKRCRGGGGGGGI